jgi:hypothetical protein
METLRLDAEKEGHLTLLSVVEPGTPWTAIACLDLTRPEGRILIPTRVHMAPHVEIPHLRAELLRQTGNLQTKIVALDRLRLAPTRFARCFSAARLFIIGDTAKGGADGWRFCRSVVDLLADYANRPIVSQVDYDQRRLHPHLVSVLDSFDFATKHEPSAVGTLMCYRTVLEQIGVRNNEISWGVKGAGQLGGRIIRKIAPDAQTVYVAERTLVRRCALADVPNVMIVPSASLPHAPAKAMVFSADTGTLNVRVARAIAQNRRVRIVGGPEAGLDHDHAALRVLEASGIWFIPSILCGSMGLVSNLEEALGHSVDLNSQASQLQRVVADMAVRSITSGRPFHKVCRALLSGAERLR